MSSTVTEPIVWNISDLGGITPEQMASCLAAGAAAASTLPNPVAVQSFTARHPSGVVVEVVADIYGQYDPEAPVFTVSRTDVAL